MRKCLIIRFSSIGDIVLTTPVIRCVKEQLETEVHFLCKKAFAGIVESHPQVDKVYTLDKDLGDIIDELRLEEYDIVIDLHKNLRSFRVARSLNAPVYSFDKINLEKWLMVNLKYNRLPDKHLVDRYFDGLNELGVKNDKKGLDYFVADSAREEVRERFGEISGGDHLCFAIGAAHATKCLETEQIIDLCSRLKDTRIFLLGGPAEEDQGTRIAKEAGDHVANTCGMLSIGGSAALIEGAVALITHDTGMMHIGAALERPLFVFWGNTIPGFGMFPYFGKKKIACHMFEVQDLACRPCSKIGFESCPKGHFNCIRDHDLESAGSVINTFLSAVSI